MSDSYNGCTYEIITQKTNKKFNAREFELYVNNELVITASELESKGIKFDDIPTNWNATLKTFARGYIDGERSIDSGLKNVKYHYDIN